MRITIDPSHPDPQRITQVVDRLKDGAVIICPTDTVYAFACSAHQPRAIERVAKLKGVRPHKAELSLICGSLAELSLYARAVDTAAFRLMKKALPGPYTFILNASHEIPKLFKNNRRTVGIRVPEHAVTQAIVKELGHALVVASVHDPDTVLVHSSEPERIEEHMGYYVDMVVDAGTGGREASTVIDLSQGGATVLRQGKGPVEDLL